MNVKRVLLMTALGGGVIVSLSGNSGCGDASVPVSSVDQQRINDQKEVSTEQTYCYECDNIKRRRILFGKPGIIGYVAFLNQTGQPVMYMTVDGKCTSSGKRLTQSKRVEVIPGTGQQVDNDGTERYAWDDVGVVDGPSEDGTYGQSDNYVYCYGTDGRYVQWNGNYLYSDKPFDLTMKPLVIAMTSNVNAVRGQ